MKAKNYYHEKLEEEALLALSELSALGLCRVWRQPTGAAYRDNTLIRYGLVGCADISGIWHNGKRLEIEIKSGRAVQSKEQKLFQATILNMKGYYIVARSVEGMLASIKSVTAE